MPVAEEVDEDSLAGPVLVDAVQACIQGNCTVIMLGLVVLLVIMLFGLEGLVGRAL